MARQAKKERKEVEGWGEREGKERLSFFIWNLPPQFFPSALFGRAPFCLKKIGSSPVAIFGRHISDKALNGAANVLRRPSINVLLFLSRSLEQELDK